MESFDPLDPKYKSVEDLPEGEKINYANLPDGGFVSKEALEQNTRFEEEADRRRSETGEELTLTAEQVAHEKALLENELRNRTVKDVENFNINEDGLVLHGTSLDYLESILRNGLGPLTKTNKEIDFQVVGAKGHRRKPGTDEEYFGQIGFGTARIKYGGHCVLVTDVFKKIWPHWIDAVVEKHPGTNAPGEHFALMTGEDGVGMQSDILEHFTDELNKPEIRFNLLNHWAFKAIVVPDKPRSGKGKWDSGGFPVEMEPEEVLSKIIEIQNRVLPKKEHVPVYDESGRCLYDPLK